MWFLFALAASIFAALTSILAKIGIDGVNSNLATAIRTVVVLFMAWGMVFVTNAQDGIAKIGRRSWLYSDWRRYSVDGSVEKRKRYLCISLKSFIIAFVKKDSSSGQGDFFPYSL